MSSATLTGSAPVYIPMHKRTPSSSSSSHSSIYSRDELLSMAPSTSTPSPSSSPSSSGAHFPSSGSDHLEHTYAHPLGPSPNHPDAQGWLALNTAMRSYLRAVCPEIVMNRKMRKAVEYASFQHRASVSARSSSRGDEQQRGASKERRGSETKRQRPASPLKESVTAPEPEEQQYVEAVPTTPSTRPSTPARRPPPRRTPASRAPRTPRTANTRARYNSFALFHRQLAGQGAGSEGSWRRPIVAELASIGA